MKFYRYLYLGEGLDRKKKKVLRRLEAGKLNIGLYIITLPRQEKNQLEIYQSSLLLQRDFPKKDLFVVGIVKGYEEALELVEEITKEVYNVTEGADIRSYILKKEQEG